MATATVNGIDLHYRAVGAEDGFPVVLVHGFTGNSRNWALTVPALRERFRCVSVDLRGHGLSARPTAREDYTIEPMASDVYGLLRHLGIDACYLVGHSMGGMVAQRFVLDHPQMVGALALVDTAASMADMKGFESRFTDRERLAEMALNEGMEAVFEEQLRMSPDRSLIEANPDFLQLWREQFLMTSPEAYAYGAHGMATRRSLTTELRKVTAPTLVVCGENDEPFIEASRRIHSAIAGSELVMIEGAGHSPQIEAPARFNQVLVGFLSRVQASVGVA